MVRDGDQGWLVLAAGRRYRFGGVDGSRFRRARTRRPSFGAFDRQRSSASRPMTKGRRAHMPASTVLGLHPRTSGLSGSDKSRSELPDAPRHREGVYPNFTERVRTSKGEAEAKDSGQLLRWAIHEVQFDRERAALRAALTEQEARDA